MRRSGRSSSRFRTLARVVARIVSKSPAALRQGNLIVRAGVPPA
jgi:hypothetical protein